MSLSIAGIGSLQPAYAPSGPIAPYAQNQTVAESVAGTIAGAEHGAQSVVYEPSAGEGGEQLTYSQREGGARAAAHAAQAAAAAKPAVSGDDAVVEATGGTSLPPPKLPDTPLSAAVDNATHNVGAPVRPVLSDPAATATVSAPAAQPNQAEAHAQATYAAIVDASIAGASLEKFA